MAAARALELALGAIALGCQAPLPDLPDRVESADAGADAEAAALVIEPAGDASAAPPVLRLRVSAPGDAGLVPLLFEGELGSYHLGKIKKGDLPATLRARSLPVLAWSAPGYAVVAPTAALTPGASYSVASEGLGLLGTFEVVADGVPVLARLWPPPGAAGAVAVYCGEPGDAPREGGSVTLEPAGVLARFTPGALDAGLLEDRCVTLDVARALDESDGALAPPLRVGAAALEPEPLGGAPAPQGTRAACEAGERPLGPGCASVDDDRIVVRAPSDARLWCLVSSRVTLLRAVPGGTRFVVRGWAPLELARVAVTVADGAGNLERAADELTFLPARPHVVISEVLANPSGREPAQEWVELVNDGSLAVELEGWALSDGAGETILPALRLEPGAYALVVREDFVRDDGADVPVPGDVPLLVVRELGKSGLSNSGEALELREPSGVVRSRFPARSASKAGVSIARREPGSLDDDALAFGRSGEAGATPGAPNTLE